MSIFNSLKKAAETAKTQAPNTPSLAGKFAPAPAPAPKELSKAEVEAIIEAKVKEKGKPFNWKVSVVDLMSVLNMNSSLDSRKALAAKLNYSGSAADGTPEKNNWLHAELLKILAKNDGKIPASLA